MLGPAPLVSKYISPPTFLHLNFQRKVGSFFQRSTWPSNSKNFQRFLVQHVSFGKGQKLKTKSKSYSNTSLVQRIYIFRWPSSKLKALVALAILTHNIKIEWNRIFLARGYYGHNKLFRTQLKIHEYVYLSTVRLPLKSIG